MSEERQNQLITILLIRHGRTDFNASGRFMGQKDVPLDEQGVSQARSLASALHRWNPVCIYSSPLSRALDTARPAASRLEIPLVRDERWLEVDLGKLAGLTWEEAAERLPDYHQERTSGRECLPPGGEPTTAVQKRAADGLRHIARRHPNQSVVVVSHGGTIKSLLSWILSAPLKEKWRMDIANGSLSVVRLTSRGWQISSLNYTDHLPGD